MSELKFYRIVWISAVLFSLWKFTQIAKRNYHFLDPSDFKKGWSILNQNKDASDHEWAMLSEAFNKYWMLLVFQVLCTFLIRKLYIKGLPLFYFFYSLSCLHRILGIKATSFYVTYLSLAYLIHIIGQKYVCYILNILAMALLHCRQFVFEESFLPSQVEAFLFDIGLTWLIARCLSFSIDQINSGKNKKPSLMNFINVIAYCLYLPSVFTGPILLYNSFDDQLARISKTLPFDHICKTLLQILYILIWCFIFNFLLHFVYSSAIQYYPGLVLKFDSWELCGLGYALPMLFFLKYFIIYGLAGNIAKLEGLDFPPPPKCITCIHLSSYLWRHFDRGLYLWILSYIYIPLVGHKDSLFKRSLAQFISFLFVCIWHGMDNSTCTWSFLNFVLVVSETIFPKLVPSKIQALEKKLSLSSQKRIKAAFETPHFILMCISSSFFLANRDIGIILFRKLIFNGTIPLLPIFFIMYCGCHTSIAAKISKNFTITKKKI